MSNSLSKTIILAVFMCVPMRVVHDRVDYQMPFVSSKITLPALAFSSLLANAEDAIPVSHSAKYMGTATCSSSNCHGGTAPRKASNVLQNEYTTWYKHDNHSKAYQVLQNEVSLKMGKHLGIQPDKDPLCLSCHATYVSDAQRHGEKFVLEDGVTCESCHGPAEQWLKTHTAQDATHAQNVQNGMTDLVSLPQRTTLCLSCHYGTDDKSVNHQIYGAGHPRISFEMDTFSVIEPKHWKVDEDYIQRKAPYISAKAWLVGQVVASREVMAALLSRKRSKHGFFPELTLFDCFSCHHNLSEEQFKQRSYDGKPGELRLNLAAMIVIREALVVVEPKLANKLGGMIDALHGNYAVEDPTATVRAAKELLEGPITAAVDSYDYSEANLRRVLKHFATFSSQFPYLKYEIAEQLAMGMSSILATQPALSKAFETSLDGVYRTLKSANDFDPVAFRAECAKFGRAI